MSQFPRYGMAAECFVQLLIICWQNACIECIYECVPAVCCCASALLPRGARSPSAAACPGVGQSAVHMQCSFRPEALVQRQRHQPRTQRCIVGGTHCGSWIVLLRVTSVVPSVAPNCAFCSVVVACVSTTLVLWVLQGFAWSFTRLIDCWMADTLRQMVLEGQPCCCCHFGVLTGAVLCICRSECVCMCCILQGVPLDILPAASMRCWCLHHTTNSSQRVLTQEGDELGRHGLAVVLFLRLTVVACYAPYTKSTPGHCHTRAVKHRAGLPCDMQLLWCWCAGSFLSLAVLRTDCLVAAVTSTRVLLTVAAAAG